MKRFLKALQLENKMDFEESMEIDLGGDSLDKAHIWGNIRREDHELILEFEGDALVDSVCDRCLEACQCSIHVSFSELVDEEIREMSLEEIARQEFILQRPLQNLCSEDCKGLCLYCGANLNIEDCGCGAPVDPRLEKLLTLIQD